MYDQKVAFSKSVSKFSTKLVQTKTEVTSNHNFEEFEDIVGEVLKRAENELDMKLTEIQSLKKEKETFEKDLMDKNNELVAHNDETEKMIANKSKKMVEVLANITKFEDEKDEIFSEIEKISAQIKMLELKKLSLNVKQVTNGNVLENLLVEKANLDKSLETETAEAQIKESDIKKGIGCLEMNLKQVDEAITNVKLFKTPVKEDPPKVNPNSMLIQFLEKSIQSKEKQLECPICFVVAKAPIFSCSESHLVCGSCRPQLKLCPECRLGYKGLKRHRYAEMIVMELVTLRQERDTLVS